jgi:glycerophosphoryl diester phosphodiesterase
MRDAKHLERVGGEQKRISKMEKDDAVIMTAAGISGAVALYLFMSMPRIKKRKDMEFFSEWDFAHRGLFKNGTEAPENSIPAFRKAIEAGFAIELDVQLTRDNVPVVIHDFDLNRACGADVKVKSLTFDELRTNYRLFGSREKVPSFAEVLELIDGKVPILVEIKSVDTDMTVCRKAWELLREYDGEWCMESFNPLCLLWFRMKHPDVIRGQLADNFIKDGTKGNKGLLWLLQNLTGNFATKPDFIAFNHKYADTLAFQINRKLFHIPAFAWTVKSEKDRKRALKDFDVMIFDSFIPTRHRKHRK